ncbi:MAG TPA: TetR/AcrR family transcriptional regulator [Nitrospirae bacterium]|nr:TetR/AcrR family transcriptional regulator [Nitrospirota bacterium]
MGKNEETRELIIDSARNRFLQYGFNKTTMAEIAKDCGMSASNLYRFFKDKNDILVEMTERCFRDTENCLREILRRPGMSAAERIKALVLEKLHINYDMIANEPKFNEIVMYITSERSDIVCRHKDALISSIAEAVAEGNRNGELEAPDIVKTADMISKATIMFGHPMLMNGYSLQELEDSATEIIETLVQGLRRR